MLVVAIAVFERKDDEHHVLYVYLVLPKRGGAEFAEFSFLSFGFLPALSDSVSGEFVESME